MSKASVDK